ALAVGAADRLGALTGTRPATLVARLGQAHVDRDLVAEHGLLERDVDGDLHVLAARRAAGPAPGAAERAAGTSEERLEDVAEVATAEDVADVRAAVGADAGLAVPVIAGPLLGVGQHRVGGRH